jgi:cell fate (sporulation/competence/biofilm development) regulator YlbF (YheA/YmcA/DUF963 family)
MDQDTTKKSPATREAVIEKLRKLAEVSKELEKYARVQSNAMNVMQAAEAKRHVDELTVRQNDLVLSIVDMHPNKEVREKFVKLGDKIEAYRSDIRACQDAGELEELKNKVDADVDEWVKQFQDISCYLAGVTPPYGNK